MYPALTGRLRLVTEILATLFGAMLFVRAHNSHSIARKMNAYYHPDLALSLNAFTHSSTIASPVTPQLSFSPTSADITLVFNSPDPSLFVHHPEQAWLSSSPDALPCLPNDCTLHGDGSLGIADGLKHPVDNYPAFSNDATAQVSAMYPVNRAENAERPSIDGQSHHIVEDGQRPTSEASHDLSHKEQDITPRVLCLDVNYEYNDIEMEYVGEPPPPSMVLQNSWAEYFGWTYLLPGLAFEPAGEPMAVDTPRSFAVALPRCGVESAFWGEQPMDIDVRIPLEDDVMQVDWPLKPDSPMMLDSAPLSIGSQAAEQQEEEIVAPVVVIVTPPSPAADSPMMLDSAPLSIGSQAAEQQEEEIVAPVVVIVTPPSPAADSPMMVDSAPLCIESQAVVQEEEEVVAPVVVIVTPPSPPADASDSPELAW